MRPYSLDLREKIVAAYEQKLGTQRELAQLFGVGKATVERIIRRHRETGSVEPMPHAGGHTPRLDEAGREHLRQIVCQTNDLTLGELRERLITDLKVELSTPQLCRIVRALNMPLKKSRFTPQSVTRRVSKAGEHSTGRQWRRSTPEG